MNDNELDDMQIIALLKSIDSFNKENDELIETDKLLRNEIQLYSSRKSRLLKDKIKVNNEYVDDVIHLLKCQFYYVVNYGTDSHTDCWIDETNAKKYSSFYKTITSRQLQGYNEVKFKDLCTDPSNINIKSPIYKRLLKLQESLAEKMEEINESLNDILDQINQSNIKLQKCISDQTISINKFNDKVIDIINIDNAHKVQTPDGCIKLYMFKQNIPLGSNILEIYTNRKLKGLDSLLFEDFPQVLKTKFSFK